MKRRGFLMLSGLAIVAGCGGGAPEIPRETRLKLDIVWPERTRALDAPAGALSAVATIESLAGGTASFPAIDREAALPGYTQNWTSATVCPTGVVYLTVRFFAGRGGLGSLVGTAAKTVIIAADGTGAGTIAVEGKIDTIAVSGPASVRVADNATYNITAKDAAGATIAVEPGAASFALSGESTALSLVANGTATGLSVGSSAIVATLGSKVSEAFAITVTAPTGAKAVIAAGQSVDVGESKKLVASVTDSSGNAVTIDPSLISYEVTVGAENLEITADGTMTGKSLGTATVKFTAGELSTTGTVAITADVLTTVDPFQSVLPGNTIALTAKVTDRGGTPITPPGSVTWTRVSGSDTLELAANGEARGLAIGVATVRATVVGVSSPAQTVLIGDVHLSETGLRSFDSVVGTGAEAQTNSNLTVHYTGWLLDGTKFESSRDNGEPASFNLGGLIKGWKEGIPGMKVGGKRFLVIPPDLAYGDGGSSKIPPKSTLVFEIELISIP